jgi:hypothetical protein
VKADLTTEPVIDALHLNKIPKTNRFRGVNRDRSARVGQVNPSSIQTITVGLGISPGPTHLFIKDEKDLLVGYTTDRELHPAPKVITIQLR